MPDWQLAPDVGGDETGLASVAHEADVTRDTAKLALAALERIAVPAKSPVAAPALPAAVKP